MPYRHAYNVHIHVSTTSQPALAIWHAGSDSRPLRSTILGSFLRARPRNSSQSETRDSPSPNPPSPSTAPFAAVATLTGNTGSLIHFLLLTAADVCHANPTRIQFRQTRIHPRYTFPSLLLRHPTTSPRILPRLLRHPLLLANPNLNNTTANTAQSTSPVLSSSVPNSSTSHPACKHHPQRSPKHSTSHPHLHPPSNPCQAASQ